MLHMMYSFNRVFSIAIINCYIINFYHASYASTVLAVVACLSVSPSICLSQVGVVQRRLNLGSH